MTPLRQKYIRDLTIRGKAENTQQVYTGCVADLASYYNRSPDLLTYDQVADWLFHLRDERKLASSSVNIAVSAARFLYPTDDKLVPFRSEDTRHVAALRDFLQANLREAELHRLPGGDKAILCGERITLFITQFDKQRRDDEPSNPTWDLAFLAGPSELRGSDPESQRDLRGLNILPVPLQNLSAVGRSQPWTAVLPPLKRSNESRMTRDLALMHDFVRCTNQLDLLFTRARIFPYLIERQWTDDGWEHLHINEAARELELLSWSLVRGGLVALLMEEVSSGKDHCREVLLTDHSRLSTGYRPNPEEWWEIHRVNREGEAIELRRRPRPGKTSPPPERGFIRTYGLYGQFSLVERRRRAIDRLKDHRFLLRMLAYPLCRDSKVFNDEIPFPDWLETKRQVAAVDILRRKVRDEAFNDKAEHDLPFAAFRAMTLKRQYSTTAT